MNMDQHEDEEIEIEIDDEDDEPTLDFDTLVAEIEDHETGSLVSLERNPVNGYVTFRFYENSGELAGKLVFDELEDGMIGATKAVADYLANAEKSVEYQTEIEAIWEDYDTAAINSHKR